MVLSDDSGGSSVARTNDPDGHVATLPIRGGCDGDVVDLRTSLRPHTVQMLRQCADGAGAFELAEVDVTTGKTTGLFPLRGAHDGLLLDRPEGKQLWGTFPDRSCDGLMKMGPSGWESLGEISTSGLAWPAGRYLGAPGPSGCETPGLAWFPTQVGTGRIVVLVSQSADGPWSLVEVDLQLKRVRSIAGSVMRPVGLASDGHNCVVISSAAGRPGLSLVNLTTGEVGRGPTGDFGPPSWSEELQAVLAAKTGSNGSRAVRWNPKETIAGTDPSVC